MALFDRFKSGLQKFGQNLKSNFGSASKAFQSTSQVEEKKKPTSLDLGFATGSTRMTMPPPVYKPPKKNDPFMATTIQKSTPPKPKVGGYAFDPRQGLKAVADKFSGVGRAVKSVAPETAALAARSKTQTTGQQIATGAKLPFKLAQELIAQPLARGGAQLVRNITTGGADKGFTPKSTLEKFAFGSERVKSLPEELRELPELGYEAAGQLPTVKMLPQDSWTSKIARFGLAAPAGLLAGGLKALDIDIGVGSGVKKAGTALVREGAERLAREEAERLARTGVERLIERGGRVLGEATEREVGDFVPSLKKALHPEDQARMIQYIDDIRLKGKADPRLELDAARIAENYNIKMPKTGESLADEFDNVLSEAKTTAKKSVPPPPKQAVEEILERGKKGMVREGEFTMKESAQKAVDDLLGLGKSTLRREEAALVREGAEQVVKSIPTRNYVEEVKAAIPTKGGFATISPTGAKQIQAAKQDMKIFDQNKDRAITELQAEVQDMRRIAEDTGVPPPPEARVFEDIISARTAVGDATTTTAGRGGVGPVTAARDLETLRSRLGGKKAKGRKFTKADELRFPEGEVPQRLDVKTIKPETFDALTSKLSREEAINRSELQQIIKRLPTDTAQKQTLQETMAAFEGQTIPTQQFLKMVEDSFGNKRLYGAVAGLEPEYDEEGRFKGVGYDPLRGVLGIGATSAVDSKLGREALSILKKKGKDVLGIGKEIVEDASKNFNEGFDADRYVKEMVKKREAARVAERGSFVERGKRAIAEIKKGFVDSTAPIEDTLTRLEKEKQFNVLPRHDIRLQIDRVLRSPTVADTFVKDNGLEDIIQNIDDPDTFEQFLIARHSDDLAMRGIETGRDIEKDRALIEVLAPKYEESAKVVNAYSQKLLDYSVDKGLIPSELAAKLKKEYPNYVPMQRVFDELEQAGVSSKQMASLSKQSVIQRIFGSKREVESPLGSLLVKTKDAIAQGERNEAARMLAGYRNLPDFPVRELKEGEKVGAQTTFSYLDNGVKRTFVTTPEIAAAAKSLNKEELSILDRAMRVPIRIFKAGTTGINPSFILANLAKDQAQALITSAHGTRTSNPMNMLRAIFSAVKHDDLYDQVVRDVGMSTSFDVFRAQPTLDVARIRSGRSLPSKIAYTVKHPGELLRAVEDIMGRTEELTRIQQYKGTYDALIKQGRTIEDARLLAAKAARENTANFARGGDFSKVINAVLPYFSAGVQGTRATLRAFQHNPVSTGFKVGASLLLPTAAAVVWNLNDDERRKVYEDISESDKEGNIIIIPPNPTKDAEGRWNIIKLPLPSGLNSLTIPIRKGLEQAYGLDPIKFTDIAQSAFGFLSPINADLREGKEGFVRSLASNLTPQQVKPTLEGYTNTRFFSGTPIVPEKMKGLPPEMQVKEDTSGIARKIGGVINTSPIKVQEWIRGTFGSASMVPLHYADALAASIGFIPEDQIGGEALSDDITRRFTKAYGGRTDDSFYAAYNKAKEESLSESWKKKMEAETWHARFSRMPKEEANAKVKELRKSDPIVYRKLKELIAEEKSGITKEERAMKFLGVENGTRAKFINDFVLAQFETPQERNTYIKELKKKKVITPNVMKQLRHLVQGDGGEE